MSDTNRLNVNITATNTASASVKELEAQIKTLEKSLASLNQTAAQVGPIAAASINQEIAAVKNQIATINEAIKAQGQLTQAMREEMAVARQLARAEDDAVNARTRSVREQLRMHNQRVYAEREAEDRLAREVERAEERKARAAFNSAFARANYEERDRNIRYDNMRRLADYENIQFDLRRRAQERAAASGGGIGGIFQRETRHIVGAFDSIARGQTGAMFSSIGAGLRDAGVSAGFLATGIGALAAVMGTAAILHGAENMGRWATQTRAAASAVGMSVPHYSQLQGALTLSGLKANEADAALRHLGRSVEEALKDPTSKAAQGFHALGISQEDIVKNGQDTEGMLKLLAKAFTETADGANKTAAMEAVLGEAFQKLIPILQNGETGLQRMKDEAKRLGITLTDEQAKALEETGQEVEKLGAAIRGSGIQAMLAWGPVIKSLAENLRELLGVATSVINTLAMLPKGIGQFANMDYAWTWLTRGKEHADAIQRLRNLGPNPSAEEIRAAIYGPGKEPKGGGAMDRRDEAGTRRPVGPMEELDPLTKMRHDAAQAAEAASRSGSVHQRRMAAEQAEIKVMQKMLTDGTALSVKQREQLETDLANKLRQLHTTEASGAAGAAKQDYRDFASNQRLRVAEADGSSKAILAIYDEWLAAARGKYQQHADEIAKIERMKVQEVNKARLQEIDESARNATRAMRSSVLDARLVEMAQPGYRSRQAGPERDLQTARSAISEAQQVHNIAAQEVADLREMASAANEDTKTRKEAQQRISDIVLAAKEKEVSLYEKAAASIEQANEKMAASFVKLFDSVAGDFSSFSKSLLDAFIAPQREIIKAGMSSITHSLRGQQIGQAFGQLIKSLGQHLLDAIGSGISKAIANALSKGASNTISELIGNWMSKAFSNVVGNVAGSAVGQAAGGAAGQAAGSSVVVTAITAAATEQSAATAALGGEFAAAITASTTAIVGAITASASVTEALLLALNVKPSFLGFTYAGGGIIPSAEGGMTVNDGKGGQLSILHPREMVLPSHISQGLQQMIARGQTGSGLNQVNTLNYSPILNSMSRGRSGTGLTRAEFSQTMSLHGGGMLGQVRNMMRGGWRPA